MISLKLLIYLSIGTVMMMIPILMYTHWYKIQMWKSIPIAVLLTISGTVGTYILYYIENHWIGGTSFYGAVFLVPVLFLLVARLVKEKYSDLLDMCAPAECIMLVIMKIQCQISGCCAGKELFLLDGTTMVRFPSQIAELINALVIFLLLICLARKKHFRGGQYPLYMIVYGSSRFVLNFFRENNTVYAMGLPAGAFWSVWSVLLGGIALLIWYNRKKTSNMQTQKDDCCE
ncbi:MAG: prolipoprotein diacylglyceryl transferase [Oscillospiraceae bacterium]|nr:prolipoprotein diacylglyceryl transferase [Oscillospiraceae bacterium]